MKRTLFTICVILSTLFFPHNALCVNEMGWTSDIAATWSQMISDNNAKYVNYKSHADNQTCTNDNYGLNYAIMYQATGDTSYCTKAYNSNGGCVAATANRNKTRDCFVERALAYSLCGNAVGSSTRAAWESQLDNLAALVQNSTHGTRPWDTDELVGHYFGCVIYDLADDGILNTCTSNALSGGNEFGIDTTSCGCYGDNTVRDCVCKYFTNHGDGEFIEGTEYNKNTLWYAFLGVHALNDYYGVDKFPEITQYFDEFADVYYNRTTPDYSQHFQWGDVQSGQQRTHNRYRTQATYAAIAYADGNDAKMWDLWDDIYTTSCVRETYGIFMNPYATRTKASGQTAANASLMGIGFWHEGWDVNDSFYSSMERDVFFADHDWTTLENWELWRNDNWITTGRKHYYGEEYNEHPYSNGLLIFGGYAGMREARGQSAWEAGSDYMYHAGLTGGFFQNQGKTYNIPVFVRESTNQRLFRHNQDDTDTIFLFNRIDACRPDSTSCMSASQKTNLANRTSWDYDRANAEDYKHIYVLNTESSPTQSGDKFTWTDGSDTVEFVTYLDTYTDETVDMSVEANYNSSPYQFRGSLISAEKSWYQLRIKLATSADAFYPILHTLHAGGTATYTEINNTTGTEAVTGAMVENATDRVVALFNKEEDTTTTFSSYQDGSNAARYDSDRFTKTEGMYRFDADGQAQFTTDDTKDIDVFILGLDPDKGWTITANGSSAGCLVSDQGVCNFTITGVAKTHTVIWTAAPFSCDDTDWRGCYTESACKSAGWYWYSSTCNQNPEDQCASDWTQCSTQATCEDAGWCWQDAECIEECVVEPPETTTVTIYASGDTYMQGDSNSATNYDGQNIYNKTSSSDDLTRVGLVSFDLSSIPTGADINSVALNVTVSNDGGTANILSAYECLRDFVEGEATWDEYSSGSSWSSGGARGEDTDMTGDYTSTAERIAYYSFGGSESAGDDLEFTSTGSFETLVEDNIGDTINIVFHMPYISSGSVRWLRWYDTENAPPNKEARLVINYTSAGTVDPPAEKLKKRITSGRIFGTWRN